MRLQLSIIKVCKIWLLLGLFKKVGHVKTSEWLIQSNYLVLVHLPQVTINFVEILFLDEVKSSTQIWKKIPIRQQDLNLCKLRSDGFTIG